MRARKPQQGRWGLTPHHSQVCDGPSSLEDSLQGCGIHARRLQCCHKHGHGAGCKGGGGGGGGKGSGGGSTSGGEKRSPADAQVCVTPWARRRGECPAGCRPGAQRADNSSAPPAWCSLIHPVAQLLTHHPISPCTASLKGGSS